MSKLNELKQMSQPLRVAMARRDTIRKHVKKHNSNAAHCTAQITSLHKKLAELTDSTTSRVAHFEADHELELDYAAKAGVLLKAAQAVVDEHIGELDKIKAKNKPKPAAVPAVDPLVGKKIKDAQEAGFDTPEQHEEFKLEEIKVAAQEATEREAKALQDRIDAAQAELADLKGEKPEPEVKPDEFIEPAEVKPDAEPAKDKPKPDLKPVPKPEDLEPEPKKEELPKGKPEVPEVTPEKDPEDDAPPVRTMSKRQRRKANRLARQAAQG